MVQPANRRLVTEATLNEEVAKDRSRLGPLELAVTESRNGKPLGTEDLSTVTGFGSYYQSSNANATIARGYPVATAGNMQVLPWGSNKIRVYWPYVPGFFYVQNVLNNVPGAWKAFQSTAGKSLGVEDLNAVMDPGAWFQASKANSTVANNYPADSTEQGAGLNLSWSDTATNRVQLFFPGAARRFHRRTVFAGEARAWETYEPSDVIESRIMGRINSEAGVASAALPTEDWAHWGDSLTDDVLLGADGWVAKLSTLTGKQHYNGGWYGQKAGEIAARMGSAPMRGTFPGGVIPAAGSTAAFTPSFGRVAQNNKVQRQILGSIAGRRGHFTSPTTGDLVFTPTDGVATPTPVSGARVFVPDNPYANRVTTLWMGTNDLTSTLTPEQLVSLIGASMDFLSPRVKRVLIFTLPQASNRAVGSAIYNKCEAVNAALRKLAPGNIVEMAAYLMSDQAATDAGITFTAEDRSDIEKGYTPRSFRSDDIHFNATAGIAIAKKVHAEAAARGWV